MSRPIPGIEDAQTLAQAIVDTIHEPLLVLDSAFSVLAASRSFYEIFKVDPEQTMGCLLYAWATASGTFRPCAYFWKRSSPSRWR